MRFDRKGKLALRFVGAFEVLYHISKFAYQLVLLASMNHIHNEFHISLLHKYIIDLTYVLWVEDVKFKDKLIDKEHPV